MEKVLLGMSADWETYVLTLVVYLCAFSFFGLFYTPQPSSNKVIAFLGKSIKPLALFQLAAIIIILITLVVSAYIETFRTHLISRDPQHWGQMGDFFGGMLNPILAFASFIALLYTIRIQSATQNEATANAKADRALSLLIPEYNRHEQLMTALINEADQLMDATFNLKDGKEYSFGSLVGTAFLKSIHVQENAAKSKIRHTPQDIGDLIDEELKCRVPDDLDASVYKYFRTVQNIRQASADIIQVIKRIELLSDVQLFRDRYQSIAKHLIIIELLGKSTICFNRFGIGVSFLKGLDEQIQKEVNRMATESFNLTIDTP